jgi:hypothetical protein
MAGNAIRVPITNIFGGGDYTAQITIGSNKTVANVIMDTGSSTLAVIPRVYEAAHDTDMQATPLAQDVIYGTGGWAGPVVQTSLSMGDGAGSVSVNGYIALSTDDERRGFGNADGILGLAYNVLNNAYDLSQYLAENHRDPAVTFPWPFPVRSSSAAIQQFAQFISRMPQQDLQPFFTAVASAGIEKNLFAFYTLRSVPSMRHGTEAEVAADPLNNGLFILGGGPEQTDLYHGDTFVEVDVVDDNWYSTDLLSVQVAGAAKTNVNPLPAKYGKSGISNSIVDSGTNSLALSPDVFNTIMSSFGQLGSQFTDAIQAANQGAVSSDSLNLENWPDITFTLRGPNNEEVPLACSPSTYWQVDSPQAGQASFMIFSSGMVQSILGLPLMNNYFTVFDRTGDPYGVVRFAPIAAP